MTKKKKYNRWTKIKWDGNPALNLMCYRKSFRNGHVSVGIGEFTNIVYSYGANSDYSGSSTRWRENGAISEKEAMKLVDKKDGCF